MKPIRYKLGAKRFAALRTLFTAAAMLVLAVFSGAPTAATSPASEQAVTASAPATLQLCSHAYYQSFRRMNDYLFNGAETATAVASAHRPTLGDTA